MTQQDEDICRRPDGSIDYAHYLQRGRVMRSEQAHRMLGKLSLPALRWRRPGLWPAFPGIAS